MPETKLDWPQLIEAAITLEGKVGNFYSAFHEYSFLNRMLFAMQGITEPVASGSRWKELGRTIREHARRKEVIVPRFVYETAPLDPDESPETPAKKKERVQKLIGFMAVKAVYALSDTEGAELPPIPTPGWHIQIALDKLGIREVPFNNTNGNIQGWSRGTEFAINPLAHNRNATVFHELGHIVLGHTLPHHYEEYETHRGVMEFQAASVTLLCMREVDLLDEETEEEIRGYCQHWTQGERPPDKAIQQVFTATDRILRAGRTSQ